MAKKVILPAPPEREELRELPQAPRMIMEISRLLRFRVRQGEEEGVMAQNTARIVLAHLVVQDNLNQLDLVKLTRLKAPTVSVLLRRMEQEGYVKRVPDEHDHRAVRVSLTEKGKEAGKKICDKVNFVLDEVSVGLTDEQRNDFYRYLSIISDNLEQATDSQF